MESYSFSEKNVLVTGASGGLGSAIVKNLSAAGAQLVVTARSEKALGKLVSELPANSLAVPLIADLSKPGDAEKLARQAIDALGHIDVLFNNAGVGYFALMNEATEENIRHLFEVNTFSPLMLIKALLPQMVQRKGGRFVNIVTCAGRVPVPTVGVYGGSKSAFAIMANTMRLELEPKGIDLLNIYLGTIDTAFEENALREEERPGLCPQDICGEPRFYIARKVLKAATGPPGEVWLEPAGKRLAAGALILPKWVDRKLASIRDKAVQRKGFKKKALAPFTIGIVHRMQFKMHHVPLETNQQAGL